VWDTTGLDGLFAVFLRAQKADVHQLLDDIGQQQEDAARRRILETKVSPSGTPWAAWSSTYAETRQSQHSLLVAEGDLADSIGHNIIGGVGLFGFGGQAVDVGSNLEYAGYLLYGTETMTARPYLDTDGQLADARDRAEIGDIVVAHISALLEAA
jgi:hypothetical protein